jgi:hypothetical protein
MQAEYNAPEDAAQGIGCGRVAGWRDVTQGSDRCTHAASAYTIYATPDESIDIDAVSFPVLYYQTNLLIQRSGGTGPMKLRQPVATGSSSRCDTRRFSTLAGCRVAIPAAQAGR